MKKLCFLLALCLLLTGCAVNQPTQTQPPTSAPNAQVTCDGNHLDEANDGFCDRCSKFLLVMVDFYTLNDIHGKLADADTPEILELLKGLSHD